jgi:DNA-directed RNA polymerase specialized sigma24 family protein
VKFWKAEAYRLAKSITRGHPLHEDLVSHVYILMDKYSVSEEDLPRTFVRFAYNQWNWYQSDFNKTFRGSANTVELSDLLPDDMDDMAPSALKLFLDAYMDQSPANETDIFCREITKMYLYGMTYREIMAETGISLNIIHKAIKQVKHDIHHSYEHRDSPSIADV